MPPPSIQTKKMKKNAAHTRQSTVSSYLCIRIQFFNVLSVGKKNLHRICSYGILI